MKRKAIVPLTLAIFLSSCAASTIESDAPHGGHIYITTMPSTTEETTEMVTTLEETTMAEETTEELYSEEETLETVIIETTTEVKTTEETTTVIETTTEIVTEPITEPVTTIVETQPYIPPLQVQQPQVDELVLLTLLVKAEALNQDELTKRLIIDTVLNRVDYPGFPKTVADVILAPVAGYTPGMNGTIFNMEMDDYHLQLVIQEMQNRTNYQVLYFRTQHFHTFGVPLFKSGDVYFSTR